MNSETRLGFNDTQILRYSPGKSVRILTPDCHNMRGTIVEQRDGGKLLVKVNEGAYLLIGHSLVELIER